MITGFKKIKADKMKDVERVQNNIESFANQLTNIPILNGVLLEDVALSGSETLVNHKLGRAYRGWIIVDKNANQGVWVTNTTYPERFLGLTAGGTVTVSLWVF